MNKEVNQFFLEIFYANMNNFLNYKTLDL